MKRQDKSNQANSESFYMIKKGIPVFYKKVLVEPCNEYFAHGTQVCEGEV